MSNGSTKVNFGGMDSTAAGIGSGARTLEERLGRMKTDLNPMRASWNGSAKDAYNVAQERWDTAMRDINAILNAVGIAVNEAGTGYRDTERLNQGAW